MIIVDDHLATAVLRGQGVARPAAGPTATTWGFHYRLVRAVSDRRVAGALTRGDARLLLAVVRQPERHGLLVLDPRLVTATAASLAVEHRLNLLAAELVASAQVHDAEVLLTERNVGTRWPSLFEELGLTLTIV